MSVQRCRRETTSTEFTDWITYEKLELNEHKKQDYYLAQIACAIYRANAFKKTSVRTEDLLLKFKLDGEKEDTEIENPVTPMTSKDIWLAQLGIKT